MQDLVFVWNALEGSCNSGVVLFLLNKKIAIKNVFADILWDLSYFNKKMSTIMYNVKQNDRSVSLTKDK